MKQKYPVPFEERRRNEEDPFNEVWDMKEKAKEQERNKNKTSR